MSLDLTNEASPSDYSNPYGPSAQKRLLEISNALKEQIIFDIEFCKKLDFFFEKSVKRRESEIAVFQDSVAQSTISLQQLQEQAKIQSEKSSEDPNIAYQQILLNKKAEIEARLVQLENGNQLLHSSIQKRRMALAEIKTEWKDRQNEITNHMVWEYKKLSDKDILKNLKGEAISPERFGEILKETESKDFETSMEQKDFNKKVTELLAEHGSQGEKEKKQILEQLAKGTDIVRLFKINKNINGDELLPAKELIQYVKKIDKLRTKLRGKMEDPNLEKNVEAMLKITEHLDVINGDGKKIDSNNKESLSLKDTLAELEKEIDKLGQNNTLDPPSPPSPRF